MTAFFPGQRAAKSGIFETSHSIFSEESVFSKVKARFASIVDRLAKVNGCVCGVTHHQVVIFRGDWWVSTFNIWKNVDNAQLILNFIIMRQHVCKGASQ